MEKIISEKEYPEKDCVVCLERDSSQLLLPCKHLCLCDVCAHSIIAVAPLCPLCRQKIEQCIDKTATTEQSFQVIDVNLFAAYEQERTDYFDKIKPVIQWDQKTLRMKFYEISGFVPEREIMEELCSVLGFQRPNKTAVSFIGTTIRFDKGEMIVEPSLVEYTIALDGKSGAKHITEEEMTQFVKNSAFNLFLSRKK